MFNKPRLLTPGPIASLPERARPPRLAQGHDPSPEARLQENPAGNRNHAQKLSGTEQRKPAFPFGTGP